MAGVGASGRAAAAGSKAAASSSRDAANAMQRQESSAATLTNTIRNYANTVAGAFGLREIARAADAWQGLENRLRLVTGSHTDLRVAINDVFDISQRTSSEMDSVGQVYQRFAQQAGALGISLAEVGALTETVSKAVAISGASAGAAEAALTQFGQALASGTLRGEELNSVLEQTPGLASAIAEGLGVAVGDLRNLAADGEITASKLVEALQRVQGSVDDKFATRIKTIGQAFTELQNAVTRYIGEASKSTGVSGALASGISTLAENIDGIGRSLTFLAITAIPMAVRGLASLAAAMWAIPGMQLVKILSVAAGAVLAFAGHLSFSADTIDVLGASWSAVVSVISDGFSDVISWAKGFFTIFDEEPKEAGQQMISFAETAAFAVAGFLDNAHRMITGFFPALRAALETGKDNFLIWAQNTANSMREIFSNLVVNIVDSLNTIPGVRLGMSLYQAPRPTPYKSVSDSFSDVIAEGEGLGLTERLRSELETRRLLRAYDGLSNGSGGSGGPVSPGGSSKKGKTKNTDPLGDFMKGMNIDHAMGEYQKYLDFLDEATGRSKDRILVTQAEWLQNALSIGAITSEEYSKALDQLVDKTDKSMGQMDQFTVQAARNIQNALGDGLYNILKGNFDDIGQAFGDTITRMVADAAAANLAGALFGDYGSTGQIGGILGNIAGSLFGGVSGLEAASQVQMAGGDGIGALIGANGWASGGYTGAGGKFEPAGVVHRGEYVFDQESTGRLGVPFLESLRRGYAGGGVVHAPAQASQPSLQLNFINQSSQPLQAKPGAMSFDGKRWVQEVILSDLRTNGPIARGMKGVTG